MPFGSFCLRIIEVAWHAPITGRSEDEIFAADADHSLILHEDGYLTAAELREEIARATRHHVIGEPPHRWDASNRTQLISA